MAAFWDDIATRFGLREETVCVPGAPHITNRYIAYLQRRTLLPHITRFRGKTALDVGTGIGRWARRLSKKADLVVGVDVSKAMIALAKRRTTHGNVAFVVAAASALPLRSDSMDLTVSCTCLQHIVDEHAQMESLREVARVTADTLLILELMSPSSTVQLTHYPTRIAPTSQYLSTLKRSGITRVHALGVDFLPFVRLLETVRNALLARGTLEIPSYGGSRSQRMTRRAYQLLAVFALATSLPFATLIPHPFSHLTRHVLLVAHKTR